MFQETKELSVSEQVSQYHHLAEAIRRGCKVKPRQIFGRQQDHRGGACAIGAALAGGYGLIDLPRAAEECPLCPRPQPSLVGRVVVHLNDDHRVTREWIADWLDGK